MMAASKLNVIFIGLVLQNLNLNYFLPSTRTTSEIILPRTKPIDLPSGERAKENISSSVKCVSCLGLPPPMGWAQRLETPPCVTTYRRSRPLGDQRVGGPSPAPVGRLGNTRTNSPVLARIIATDQPSAGLCEYSQAISVPSGEIEGLVAGS